MTSDAEQVHEDEAVEIGLTTEGGEPASIRWIMTRDGENAAVSLSNEGGTLSFDSAGDYVLSAVAADSHGREFSSNSISIKVIDGLTLSLTSDAEKVHEDETAKISLTVANGTPSSVQWSMTCDGEGVAVSLADDGGTLSFESVGSYVLSATVTDELGKEFTTTLPIEVYPVIVLTLDVPENTHIDQPATVGLTGSELDVAWVVTSEAGTLISNALGNNGGEVTFPEVGSYDLTASVTDELGRTFSASGTIALWNTMRLSFQLPAFSHTDETVKVKMTAENLGQSEVAWSLTVDGQPVSLASGIKGSLDNDGGSVKFTQTGTNILTASVTDTLGRTFSYEQTIEIYPVLTLEPSADAAAHTDEQISISLSKDTALPVAWKISPSNDPSTAAAYTGSLTDNGGAIQIASAGTYDIAASVTDTTGRVFSADAVSVMVYPVAGLTFTLPAAAWTDSNTPVDLLTTDLQGQDVTWTLTKDGAVVSLTGSMLGDLGNQGGAVRFPEVGTYTLTASALDGLGREYSCSQTIRIYPVVSLTVSAREMSHTDTAEDVTLTAANLGKNEVAWTVLRDGVEIIPPFALNANGGHGFFSEAGLYTFTAAVVDELGRVTVEISGAGSLDVSWGVKLGGRPVTLDSNTGFLSNDGGTLALYDEGTYTITATVREDAGNLTSAFANVTATNTAPVIDSFTANATRNMKDGRFYADLNAVCSDPDGDAVHLEWSSEYQPDGYYEVGTHTIRVRAVDEWGAVSAWESRIIEFINNTPVITSFTADVTRQINGNDFYADLSATADDPDGNTVTLEWGGDYTPSGWYSRTGTHTIRVRAVDQYGAASAWQEKTIEFVNQAPSKPVITKTPASGVVRPSQTVTITASSTDPEGDAITYEWEGRKAESATYDYGKQIIKCRAVDALGAASPWSAIVFFVADDNGGGMTLTTANSYIEELGVNFDVDGETIYGYITEYTYNVPPVSGHNGSDYGRIEAYNILTGAWDEIAYKTKVSYTMRPGYEELQPQYANLTINKATPEKSLVPVVVGVTDSSITIEVVDGMTYSIDGGNTWQTTDTFTGLTRDTTYLIKVRGMSFVSAVEALCGCIPLPPQQRTVPKPAGARPLW